jgi:mannosyltransferase OCH1-like enzyme
LKTKKKNTILLALICLGITGAGMYLNPPKKSSAFVSFQTSISRNLPDWPDKKWKRLFSRKTDWAITKKCYETFVVNGSPSETPRIPKIIHQIWLGSPFPEKYRSFQQSWIAHHPDWEYRLWTEESLKDFPLQNQELYDSAVNWGEKSDILRYEILYRIGGVYVDTDFECFKSLEPFHYLLDFYTGLFNLDRKFAFPRMGNALIGACPGHPILKACVDNLCGDGSRENCDEIQKRTGPIYFTRKFLDHALDGKMKNAALPFPYFYPLPAEQREEQDLSAWMFPETYALHHWEASWVTNPLDK